MAVDDIWDKVDSGEITPQSCELWITTETLIMSNQAAIKNLHKRGLIEWRDDILTDCNIYQQ